MIKTEEKSRNPATIHPGNILLSDPNKWKNMLTYSIGATKQAFRFRRHDKWLNAEKQHDRITKRQTSATWDQARQKSSLWMHNWSFNLKGQQREPPTRRRELGSQKEGEVKGHLRHTDVHMKGLQSDLFECLKSNFGIKEILYDEAEAVRPTYF